MKRFLCILAAAAAIAFAPGAARAQHGPGNNMCGWTPVRIISGTVEFPTIRQNCFQVTLSQNVTSSSLYFPYNGEWVYITLIQPAAGGATFVPPPETLNWQPIDTRPYSGTPGSTAGVTTEMGYWDGTHLQIVGAYIGSGTGCSNGASDTRYVDSAAGSDSNTGLNWCSAYATEQTAVTALTATGGWVYEAPNYTGAAAATVPANIHILRTNQFDSHGSTSTRFSYPDWLDATEDHPSFAVNTSATTAQAHTAYTALGPFSLLALTSSVLGNTYVPSSAAAPNVEQTGVAGITTNHASSDIAQSDGVYGGCLNDGTTGLDCSGVVAVTGNTATAGSTGSFEAIWANISAKSPTGGAMGLVIRANGGNMPTTEIDPNSGRPNSMIDLEYGGTAGDSFYSGIYFQNQAVNHWPIVFSGNATTLNPHTNVYTMNKWHDYYSGSTAYDDITAVKVNNNPLTSQGAYQMGNYIYTNSANASEAVLPINYNGTFKLEGLYSVPFNASMVFDRSKGSVQAPVLTANVTSSVLNNCVAGQTVVFDIIENATGGFTFAWPANFHGATAITTTANEHNRQSFYCDGTNVWSTSAMQSGT